MTLWLHMSPSGRSAPARSLPRSRCGLIGLLDPQAIAKLHCLDTPGLMQRPFTLLQCIADLRVCCWT